MQVKEEKLKTDIFTSEQEFKINKVLLSITQYRYRWRALVNSVMNLPVP
jgi:hypothetical protein